MIIEPQNSLIDVMKIPRNKESTQLGGRIENSNNKKKEKAVEEVAFHWTGFVFQYFLFCFGFFFGFFFTKIWPENSSCRSGRQRKRWKQI